jgi:hypothetical protein
MILRLFSAITLTLLCSQAALAAEEHPGPHRLGGSTVSWNGNRLTVALTNAPVKGVLKDLMTSDGYVCQVTGDLPGTVSITLENLTVMQAIRRIMRNQRYDYTMILAEPGSPDAQTAVVTELAIYKDKSVVRLVTVPKNAVAAQPGPVGPPPVPVEPPADKTPVPSTVATEEALKSLDSEIKALMDEALAEEKMSQAEYDQLLQTMSTEKKKSSE